MIPDKDKIYYLASPYSTPKETFNDMDPSGAFIKEMRYSMVIRLGAELINRGYLLLEPIASCHPTSCKYSLPQEFSYWEKRDKKYINIADGLFIACFDGWDKSTGVTAEIIYAKELGKPIYYIGNNINDVYSFDFKIPWEFTRDVEKIVARRYKYE